MMLRTSVGRVDIGQGRAGEREVGGSAAGIERLAKVVMRSVVVFSSGFEVPLVVAGPVVG